MDSGCTKCGGSDVDLDVRETSAPVRLAPARTIVPTAEATYRVEVRS